MAAPNKPQDPNSLAASQDTNRLAASQGYSPFGHSFGIADVMCMVWERESTTDQLKAGWTYLVMGRDKSGAIQLLNANDPLTCAPTHKDIGDLLIERGLLAATPPLGYDWAVSVNDCNDFDSNFPSASLRDRALDELCIQGELKDDDLICTYEIDSDGDQDSNAVSYVNLSNWIQTRQLEKFMPRNINIIETPADKTVRVLFEAVDNEDHGDGPIYAEMEVNTDLLEQLKQLQELCIANNLVSLVTEIAPIAWGPGEVANELQLQGPQLTVSPESFSFLERPAHRSNLIQTRHQNTQAFIDKVSAALSSDEHAPVIYFGEDFSEDLVTDLFNEQGQTTGRERYK